jgi:hypothetical protein
MSSTDNSTTNARWLLCHTLYPPRQPVSLSPLVVDLFERRATAFAVHQIDPNCTGSLRLKDLVRDGFSYETAISPNVSAA